MNTSYVLIDYENVQPEALTALERDHFIVLVFVGSNQAKVTYEVASVLQRMGNRAEYIKIAGSGKNALDFHIAYYIGHLSAKEPNARFHIVSKDSGFDPLIQHLKTKKIPVSRVKNVSDLPLTSPAVSKSAPDRVAVVIANLKHRGASNPRTLKTLASTINSLFQKSLTESEVQNIIAELKKKGLVIVNQTKVSYALN